jgi:hypothetical protein
MADRRRQGLCYNCEEKFMPGHRCKRLFMLEIVPDDYDDDYDKATAEEPAISLHALTGIQSRSAQTMQLLVQVGTK